MNPISNGMKKILFLFAVLAAFLAAAPAVRAFDFSFVPGAAGHKLIPAGEVHRDNVIALFFETVAVDGKVEGDVFAAAKTVTIRGEVAGDVFAAADAVRIEGKITGSVWAAANAITISGQVNGNVYVLADEAFVSAAGKIDRSFTMVGGKAVLDGAVGWQAQLNVQEAIVRGAVGRSLIVSVPSGDRLRMEEKTRIGERLVITAASPAKVPEGAAAGGVVFQSTSREPSWGNQLFFLFLQYAGLVLVGLIFLHLFPRVTAQVARHSFEMRPRVFLQGLAALILAPALSVVLAFLLIGLPVAILLLAVWFFFLYTAPVFFGICLGMILLKGRRQPLFALLLGTAVVLLISHLPIVGLAFQLFVAVIVLGAWIQTYRHYADHPNRV